MEGERVWATVAAVAATVISFAASAAGVVSGSIGGSGGGFGIQINYTCTGAPTCTGTYTSSGNDGSCQFTSNGTVTFTGLDPSQPSSSGTASFSNFNYNNAPAGSCAISTTTATGNFMASSDGVAGSMTITTTSPGQSKTLTGPFNAGSSSNVRISGAFGATDPLGGFFQATFSCTGMPTCTGSYVVLEQDEGCSNTFTMGSTLVLNGFDLSPPGTFSGTLVRYGDSHSSVGTGGVCTYGIRDNLPRNAPYTATWDGTNGSFVVQFTDDHSGQVFTVPGTFTAAGIAPPPTFPMTVTSSITPTTANVAATITPKPQDVGTTQSVFVFAYAPQSLLAGSKVLKDGPDPCVLAQVNGSGQLVGTTSSTMAPVLTGVLNGNGTAIGILSNVNTPNVAGASFYVGYGTNPNGMFNNGTFQGVVNVPGAHQCQTNLATTATPALPGALTGLWWNANESGWGIHFTQRGSNVFAAWYTYDAAGKPKWYVSTCSGFTGASGTCNGTVFEVTGPNFFGGAFNPSLVNASNAGTLTLTFSNPNAASMTYNVAGVTRTVALTRQPLGGGTTAPAVDFSDIWWGGAAESGWGLAMAQQSGITFLAWYVYDANGKPTWLVATCTMSGNTGTGQLFRTSGPPFGPSFNSSSVTATAAGTVTVTFTDPNNALLDYTVDGVTGHKAITRQVF